MPPALIAVGIAAAGSVASAAIGNKATSKAVKANTASANATEATTRQIYGENKATLAPFVNQGAPASYAINSFLGLSPTQQPQQQQPNALSQFQGGQSYGYEGMDGPLGGYRGGYQPEVQNPFGNVGWNGQPNPGNQMSLSGQQQPQVNGRDAFRTFLDNSDYGFQFQQGGNAVNSGYAGSGVLQSGAAMKGLEKFRQNLQSGYRGEFLNALGNQQGVGLTAASAQAGVGTQFANSLGANNQNRADGIANGALIKGQNTAGAINGITSAVGGFLGRGK